MADFTWGPGGSQMTPERIASLRKVADALAAQGMDASPVQSWSQGAARVAQAALGAWDNYRADAADSKNMRMSQDYLYGGSETPTEPAATGPVAAAPVQGNSADAIASIESGGKYDTLGPVIPKSGDRAYGKYQVMGANVPAWSKAHLGQEMTPEQFLANPQAQDAVFKGQFGQYEKKYGPEGAAKAWFAGEGGMNNPNAKDMLGTSVASYADKFNRAMGSAPEAQTVAAAMPGEPAALPPNAQPAQYIPGQGAATPAVAKVSDAMSNVNKRDLAVLSDPRYSEGAKKIALLRVQAAMKDAGPTDDTKEYDRATKDPAFRQYLIDMKKAGKPETTINNTVNPILKGVGDRFNDSMDVARASIPQIQGIHEARKALDQGAITGLGADPKLFLSKAANLFGLGSDVASNTEVARSAIGNSVLAKAKTLGANPSNADRDYIEKVVGGSIVLEEQSIRRLLDMQEKWARDAIRRANSDGKRLLGSQPEELKGVAGLMSVEEPGSYEDFIKANPMAPTTAPAPVPGKVRKFNPATGRIE